LIKTIVKSLVILAFVIMNLAIFSICFESNYV